MLTDLRMVLIFLCREGGLENFQSVLEGGLKSEWESNMSLKRFNI